MIPRAFYVKRKGGRGWYKPGELKAKFERRYLAFKQRSDARARKRAEGE